MKILASAAIGLVTSCLLVSCSSPTPNRMPVGEMFPSVVGAGLDGKTWRLPEDLAGKPALLLVGYEQNAQFGLDRWLLGLQQAEVDVAALEVPTIKGMVPGMFSGTIDNGMRRGIPKEDWGSVVTVYDDAGKIVAFTGNQNPRNGRILLLDATGVVRWFSDVGYSASKVLELKRQVAALQAQ